MAGVVSGFVAPGLLRSRDAVNPLLDFRVTFDSAAWAGDPSAGIADGATIASWPTWGTYTNPLVQGTGAAQPVFDEVNPNLNNRASWYFDGVDDYLATANWAGTSATPVIIMVARCRTLGTSGYYFDNNDLTQRYYVRKSGTNVYVIGGTTASVTTAGAVDTDPHLLYYLTSATGSVFDEDGTSITTSPTSNSTIDGLTVAAAGNGTSPGPLDVAWICSIPSSFWFLGGADATARIDALVAWLAAYYGITMA